MKKALLFLSFLFSLLLLFSVANSLTCNIYYGGCPSGYSCLFSLYYTQNSHAGACGYYSYSVCCDEIFSYINQTCNASTSAILSFYQPNNTHVAEPYYYNWKLCAGYSTYPLECTIRQGPCYEDETCLVSLYSTVNSHVANCGYYNNNLCCKKLSDLMVNSSSFQFPSNLIFGSNVTINITIWNIGDTTAYNVNFSCYENGRLFDSKIIPSIPIGSSYQVSCNWTVSCLTNISVKVDPDNLIKELNEDNNEAWQQVSIIEYLNVTIDYPANEQSFYRGQTIWLNSTINSSCGNPTSYDVYWFNESTFIGKGEDIQWIIPLDDGLLGRKNITAYANSTSNYIADSKSINITILNNVPNVTKPRFNVTPAEVESGNGIKILCDAYDLEDCFSPPSCLVKVNISILDPDGNWNNATAYQIGNTFYRDYTAPYSPLGNYTVYCIVVDTDNGYNESLPSTFLVYQNATVTVNLNASYYWWGDGVKVYGSVKRKDGSSVSLSDTKIYLNQKLVCNATTNMTGDYVCEFKAPSSIGNYNMFVEVIDSQTGKIFTNSTILIVKLAYGVQEKELERAKQVSCYEVPQLVVNPDGSMKQVFVKVCVLQ
jgi:hypothetical protein